MYFFFSEKPKLVRTLNGWETVNIIFQKNLFVFYAYDCFACMYVYAPSACSVQRGQKRESDLQELEFPLDVNCHEGWELNSGPP